MNRKENAPDTYKTSELVATYEELLNVSSEQQTTYYFGDYSGHYFKYGITQEQKNTAYEKALAAIELDSATYQSGFVYRGDTIIRMRACLLANELQLGEKVLFIPTEPTGAVDDFSYEIGVIKTIDQTNKTCTLQCQSQELEGALGTVLARYNPDAVGVHFGIEHFEPLLGLYDTMGRDFLRAAQSEWQAQQEKSQMTMTM